jgi:predicted dehydrogenase
VSPPNEPSRAPDEGPLGVALIGAGRWGQKLARALCATPGAELRWVCDPARVARERAAAIVPGAALGSDLDAALADSRVSAVVIATPPRTHAALALRALAAGRDAFVEKPMTLGLADAFELERAARRSGRRVMVGHILEFHPAVAALRSAIAAGELGEVRLIVSERLGASPRRSESAWWSLAPHDVSLTRYLLQREIRGVVAGPVGASVVARLDVDAGPSALVHLSDRVREKTQRVAVLGTGRIALFDDVAPAAERLVFHDVPRERRAELAELAARARELSPRAARRADDPLDGFAPTRWVPPGPGTPRAVADREPLALEVAHFVAALRGTEPLRSDVESGRKVVAVLEAGSASWLPRAAAG